MTIFVHFSTPVYPKLGLQAFCKQLGNTILSVYLVWGFEFLWPSF